MKISFENLRKMSKMKFREVVVVAHDTEGENGEKSRTSDVFSAESESISFENFLLSSPVLEGLKRSGFKRPSPIQLKAIPVGRLGFGKNL